jgi:SAM-dependent methyltransferase
MTPSPSHAERDRQYHNAIAPQYERVVVSPRWLSINALFRDAPRLLGGVGRTKMLDIGTGTGHMLRRFGGLFERVVAVDHSEGMLAIAQHSWQPRQEQKVEYITSGVLEYLRSDDEVFDLITCVGFAHHLAPSALPELLERTGKRLAPGGLFILAEPIQGVSIVEPNWLARWNRAYRDRPENYATNAEDPEEGPIDYVTLKRLATEAGLRLVQERRGWEVFPRSSPPSALDRFAIPLLHRLAGDAGPVFCGYFSRA